MGFEDLECARGEVGCWVGDAVEGEVKVGDFRKIPCVVGAEGEERHEVDLRGERGKGCDMERTRGGVEEGLEGVVDGGGVE